MRQEIEDLCSKDFCKRVVITAFSPLDDEFRLPMSNTEIKSIGVSEREIEYENPETFEITLKTVKT